MLVSVFLMIRSLFPPGFSLDRCWWTGGPHEWASTHPAENHDIRHCKSEKRLAAGRNMTEFKSNPGADWLSLNGWNHSPSCSPFLTDAAVRGRESPENIGHLSAKGTECDRCVGTYRRKMLIITDKGMRISVHNGFGLHIWIPDYFLSLSVLYVLSLI